MIKEITFVLMLLPFTSYAAEQDFSSCAKDSDCTAIKQFCGGWIAVNKTKVKEAEAYDRQMIYDCVSTKQQEKPNKIFCNGKAKCEINSNN